MQIPTVLRAVFRRVLICIARFTAQRLLGPQGDAIVTLVAEQIGSVRKKQSASRQ